MAMPKVMQTIINEVQAYLANPAQGQLRAMTDRWKTLLEAEHLAYRGRFDPRFCGVYPGNRGGVGLIPVDVHTLLRRVANYGWVWAECAHASALECDGDKETQKFNVELAEKAGGLLAKVEEQLKIATLEASHNTAGLRCVKAGVRGIDNDALVDEHGNLSLARLKEKCSEHARAVEVGLEYLVIKKKVAHWCPDLPRLISQAGNLIHETMRPESEWSLLREIHARALKNIDWAQIESELAALKPSFAGNVHHMCRFVEVWSGGKDASLLMAVEEFLIHAEEKRVIPPSIFASFAALNFSEAPVYIEACFVGMYNAPTKFVEPGSNIVRLLSQGDIASIAGRNRSLVLDASKLLIKARAILKPVSLPVATKAKLLADLDLNVVMRVHLKSKDFKSLDHVAAAFWDAIQAAGAGLKGKCPWERAPNASPSGTTSIREFTTASVSEKTLLASLAARGITVGALLIVKSDTSENPVHHKVESIAHKEVTFVGGNAHPTSQILDMYKVVTNKVAKEHVPCIK